jgi:hypothetical protein
MGRKSFTQELKALARQAGEGMDAGSPAASMLGNYGDQLQVDRQPPEP